MGFLDYIQHKTYAISLYDLNSLEKIYDFNTGIPDPSLPNDYDYPYGLKITPDNKYVIFNTADIGLIKTELETNISKRIAPAARQDFAISTDGKYVVYMPWDGKNFITFYDLRADTIYDQIKKGYWITEFKFSNNGKYFTGGTNSIWAIIYDLENKNYETFGSFLGGNSATFSSDLQYFATSSLQHFYVYKVHSDIAGRVDDELQNSVQIVPNPVNNDVEIKIQAASGGNLEYKLISTEGRTLMEKHSYLPAAGNSSITIQASEITNGTYFIQITNNLKTVTKKIVINH